MAMLNNQMVYIAIQVNLKSSGNICNICYICNIWPSDITRSPMQCARKVQGWQQLNFHRSWLSVSAKTTLFQKISCSQGLDSMCFPVAGK